MVSVLVWLVGSLTADESFSVLYAVTYSTCLQQNSSFMISCPDRTLHNAQCYHVARDASFEYIYVCGVAGYILCSLRMPNMASYST